jgi:phage baseplate assembly protein W
MANPISYAFPLRRGPQGGFAMNSDTLSAIGDDIRILLLTNHGERPGNYSFGCNFNALMFEQEGAALNTAISDTIKSELATWMPFVRVVSLKVNTNATDPSVAPNVIQVELEFGVANIDLTLTIKQLIPAGTLGTMYGG